MDTFNINILPEENSVNITQGEPVNISVSQEVVQIAKIDESVNLEFLGNVTQIDANYPEALAAAQTAIEKAAEIEQTVEQGTADFNANAAEKTTEFNQNAANQTTAFNDNATSKTNDFNTNATNKTNAFNQNATDKTTAFNTNAAEKQAEVDASAALAKQYAIGDPTEPLGNSAKYWAEQASSELSGLTSRVSSIEGKIPSTATANNQLTDKSYVDTADTALQTQIDALSAASDVSDIVGTYAELRAYDTSTLQNNNIIKVLQDETHNNETTYYRWVITGGVGAWVLIGEEGPYYTIAAADATFQEKLVSGTNIKTVNGNSLVGSGNVDIDALPSQTGQGGKFLTTNGTTASWAEASATPDNKSINKNTSNALQAIGVINQNDTTTALKTWSGTKAQYDAIVTKDPNTLYNITDDTDVSLTILEALCPVGSIYITTNAACPLSTLIAGSTWVQETSRVLVEKKEPTDSDQTWYNLYSDGWCEQGGSETVSAHTFSGTYSTSWLAITKTLQKPLSLCVSCSGALKASPTCWVTPVVSNDLTSVDIYLSSVNLAQGAGEVYWEVKGYTSTTTSHKQFRRTA